jgi:hypothetical protein
MINYSPLSTTCGITVGGTGLSTITGQLYVGSTTDYFGSSTVVQLISGASNKNVGIRSNILYLYSYNNGSEAKLIFGDGAANFGLFSNDTEFALYNYGTASNSITVNRTTNAATFAGNVDLGDSSNISMNNAAAGQLQIKGAGYTGAIALDATAMYVYHNSSLRDLVLGTNEVARLTIDGSSGNATFVGRVMADTHFQSSDTNATLSATGTGNVYLRPNGYSTTTGQVHINTSGDATFAGNITFGDSHFIGDDSDDNLLIQSSANENIIINSPDDDVLIRTAGTTRLQITNTLATFSGLVSGITPVAAANFVTKAYVDGGGGAGSGFLPLTGGTMTGNTDHNDNVYSRYGTADQLRIWNNGSNSYIFNYNSGNINIGNDAADKDVIFYADRGDGLEDVFFRLDGSETNGTTVLGVTLFPDKSQARFGNQGDLRIYHDGSNSYIQDTGTGTLNLQGSTQVLIGGTNGEVGVQYVENAGVGLRHNNVTKLTTESTGINVVGNVLISDTGNDKYFGSNVNLILNADADGNSGTSARNIIFQNRGSEKMRIDADGNVGIGTTSPNHRLDIYSNENVPLRIHRPNNANLDSAGAWGIGFSTRGDAVTSTTDTRSGIFSYYNGNLFLATNNTRIDQDPDSYARLTISSAGAVKFNSYGAGTLVTDASGNITVSSGGGVGGPYLPLSAGPSYPLTGVLYIAGTIRNSSGDLEIRNQTATGFATATKLKQQTVNGLETFLTFDGTTRAAYFSNQGNVGIGEQSPSAKLQITTPFASSPSDSIFLFTNGSNTPGGGSEIIFGSSTSATPTSYNAKIAGVRSSLDNGSSDLWFQTTHVATGTNTPTTKMIIKSDGNVGIGTASPSEKLTLQLNTQNQAFSGKNGTDYLWFLRNEAGAGARQSGRFQLMDTDVTTVNIESASNRNTYFNAGNVGIGTTSPTAKLHVVGTGLFTGLVSGITPTAAANFATKAYVDGLTPGAGVFLPLAGGTMSGNIAMGDNDITGIDQLTFQEGSYFDDVGSSNYIRLKYNSTVNGGLRVEDNQGHIGGYLYSDGNTTSSFGLLDGSASWAVRCVEDEYVELRYDNVAKFQTLTDGVYVAGKLGIGTSNPDGDGYAFAEDLVIKGGASASDGAGITIAGNGKRYGIIAFGDAADSNAGEIFYDHNVNAMYFRTNGSSNVVFINSAGKVTAGAATGSSDGSTTLTTKGYVDAQISSIPSGLNFQGNWNASTNSPTLASGTGTPGFYYNVSVAGNTNLDGETDWQVGDWAVFVENGTNDFWEKIDNTSALTGVGANNQVSIWGGTNTLEGSTGLTFTGGSLYVTGDGNSAQWAEAYNNQITAISDSGSSTITLTLTQEDGGTLTTSFSNPQGTVTGTGVDNKLALWNGTTAVDSNENLSISGNDLAIGTQAGTTTARLLLYGTTANNGASVIKTTNGNLHIDSDDGHSTYVNYYTGTDTGSSLVIGNGASGTSGTFFQATGDVTIGDELTITTIANATSDTDKFLVADGTKVKYRTGAQVLSDIGAASSGSLGNYLPLAGGTMTGDIQFNEHSAKFNESGVRSWDISAGSANLNITSGDSGGLVYLSPGISVEDNAFIGGYASITGNLTVNGATATFNPDADSSLTISNAGTDAIAVFAGTGDTLYLGGNNTTGMYLDASANATFAGKIKSNLSSTNDSCVLVSENQHEKVWTTTCNFTYTGAGTYYFNLAFGGSGGFGFDLELVTARNGNYRNFGKIKDSSYIYWETDGDFAHQAQGPLDVTSDYSGGEVSLDAIPTAYLSATKTATSYNGSSPWSYFIKRYAINLTGTLTGSDGYFKVLLKTTGFTGTEIRFLNQQ